MIIPQKEQNNPFINAVKRGNQNEMASPMPLRVIRERSRGSNQSRDSGGDGMVTPKYGNNESASLKPVSFSIDGELMTNQVKLKTGVKAEDIEKIVEKVGLRLRKT